MTKMHNTDG